MHLTVLIKSAFESRFISKSDMFSRGWHKFYITTIINFAKRRLFLTELYPRNILHAHQDIDIAFSPVTSILSPASS